MYAKDEDTNLVDEVTLAHVFIATATMLPLSIWLFIYASKVHYGLSMYQTRQNAETRASRMRAIRRVLVVAMVFSLCYFMRGACVLMYAIDFFSGYSPTKHFSIMGWYLCSQWIPFVIPVHKLPRICFYTDGDIPIYAPKTEFQLLIVKIF